ncbi:unnamed protein product, partial [Mesorhabditis spiculigera]
MMKLAWLLLFLGLTLAAVDYSDWDKAQKFCGREVGAVVSIVCEKEDMDDAPPNSDARAVIEKCCHGAEGCTLNWVKTECARVFPE